jgi:hypothetical protein
VNSMAQTLKSFVNITSMNTTSEKELGALTKQLASWASCPSLGIHLYLRMYLKVPKREIFDRSDFPDFYRIKSSWVGDLVVKNLLIILIFEEATLHLVFDAHAEHTRKELMRMLSMRISYLRVCSACAPVPYGNAQHGLKGPLSNL